MEVRFRNPYRYWLSGLLAELAVFGGFLAVLALLAALMRLVVR